MCGKRVGSTYEEEISAGDDSSLRWCFLGSSELSHLILDIAISHVSRTHRAGSLRNSFRITSEDGSDIAPIASAACEGKKNSSNIEGVEFFVGAYLMTDHGIFRSVAED